MHPPKKVGQTHNRKETGPREVVGLPGKRGRLPGDVSFAHPHPITLARTHLCSGWQPSVDEPPLSAWLPSTLGPPPHRVEVWQRAQLRSATPAHLKHREDH